MSAAFRTAVTEAALRQQGEEGSRLWLYVYLPTRRYQIGDGYHYATLERGSKRCHCDILYSKISLWDTCSSGMQRGGCGCLAYNARQQPIIHQFIKHGAAGRSTLPGIQRTSRGVHKIQCHFRQAANENDIIIGRASSVLILRRQSEYFSVTVMMQMSCSHCYEWISKD